MQPSRNGRDRPGIDPRCPVGPPGKGKEGGEAKRREGELGKGKGGRESRNPQIQSWQAYSPVKVVSVPKKCARVETDYYNYLIINN